MRLILLLTFGLFILGSCSKDEPCTDSVLGTYTGTCSTNSNTFQGDLTISKSAKGDYNVLIEDELLNSGEELIEGEVSESCNKITIPLQNVTNGSLGYTISGEFNLNGNSLTGTISLVGGGVGIDCTYNMSKR